MHERLILAAVLATALLGCQATEETAPSGLDRLVFVSTPSSVQAGVAPATPVQVAVIRADGSVNATSQAAVSLAPATALAGDTLRGATIVQAVAGVATFPALDFGRPRTVQLVATSPRTIGALSAGIVVLPGPPAAVRVTQTPTAGTVNSPLVPALRIALLDGRGNPASVSGAIQVTIAAGPPTGILNGTAITSLVNGVATFADLRLSAPGVYVLQAAAVGLALPIVTTGAVAVAP